MNVSKHPVTHRLGRRTAPLLLGLALSLGACEDDEPTEDTDGGAEQDGGAEDAGNEDAGDEDAGGEDGGAEDAGDEDGGAEDAGEEDAGGDDSDSTFLLHSATQDPEGMRTNYFSLADSLTKESSLDYRDSITLPGRARLYAQADFDFFAIGDPEALTITRYDFTDEGKIEEGDGFSLQPAGVTSLGAGAVYFVSETKAYYKDPDQGQIIVFNPDEMALDGTLELPEEIFVDDYTLSFGDWNGREGEAYFTINWSTETYDQVLPRTTLVRVDTETDEVTLTDDDRCANLVEVGALDGDLYFFSGVINAFGYAVYGDDGGMPACALRVEDGETEFDPDYVGDVQGALSDSQAGTVIAVTEDGTAWVQVADLDIAPTEPGTTYSEWYATGWTWFRVPLDTLKDPAQVTEEPGAYSGFTATEGASFLIAQTEADYSTTTLMDLSQDEPEAGLSFDGFALGVTQVQ